MVELAALRHPTRSRPAHCRRRPSPIVGLREAAFWHKPREQAVGTSAAQKAGLAYERKVAAYLRNLCQGFFAHGPWITYVDDQGRHYAQPDIIAEFDGTTAIIEVKLTHTEDAYGQLYHLYYPLMRHIFQDQKDFALIEICKNLTQDAAEHVIATHLGSRSHGMGSALATRPPDYSVWQWIP